MQTSIDEGHSKVISWFPSKDIEKFPDITGPVNQAVIDLVSAATNPQKLSQMEPHWHPWL